MAQVGETELDLRALSRALWRRAWIPTLLAILAAVATYVALSRVEPLYTADTSILIEERESPLTRPRDGEEARADFDEPAIQSQVEVTRSREIAEAVIDKLDLTRRPELDPATRPSFLRSLLVMLGMAEHPAEATIRQRVMAAYFDRLSVFPVLRSRVIGVTFQAPDPVLAADIANSIADTFVELQQEAQRESAVAATAWLEQEIDRLRQRVAEAEQATAEYRTQNELFGTGEGGSLSQQQLNDLNAELARARAARAEAEARAELIESLLSEGGALEASEEVLSSALIQRLRERQVALRAELAELSTTLLPGHPRIRAMRGQLADLEAQITQEAERVLASLNTAARVAAAREDSLLESLNTAMENVSRTNVQEIELRALEREATAQRDLLETFLGRYREAVARTDANYLLADARIISRASPPQEPSYPKKAMMTFVVTIAVFLIATAMLILREFISGRAFRMIGYGPVGAVVTHAGGGAGAARLPVVDIEAETAPEPPPLRPARDTMHKFEAPPSAGPAMTPPVEPDFDPPPADVFDPIAEAENDIWREADLLDDEDFDSRAERPLEPDTDLRPSVPWAAASADQNLAAEDQAPDAEAGRDSKVAAEKAKLEAELRLVEAELRRAETAVESLPDIETEAEWEGTVEPAGAQLVAEEASALPVRLEAADPFRLEAAEGELDSIAEEIAVAVDDSGQAGEDEPSGLESAKPAAEEATVESSDELPPELPSASLAPTPPQAETEEPVAAASPPSPGGPLERDPPGTAELAEIVSSGAVRIALFVGAKGGEGVGEIAYATARQVVAQGLRSVVIDIGSHPSAALGGAGEPGLADLLVGAFSFGEVIRRDEPSNVHVIPRGKVDETATMQRLQLVIGALSHTYDKVVVVADSFADWPEEHLRPDLAAIVCGPHSTEDARTEAYELALARGARSAIIVRYASDGDGLEASEAA